MARPRKPIEDKYRTPARTIRVTDADWHRWQEAAVSRGVSVSGLIRSAVEAHIREQ
jgi:hypothetical protein